MRSPLHSSHDRITAAFLLAIVLLGIVTIGAYRSTSDFVSTAQREIESHESVEQLQHLVALLREAEAGKRGFLLTGEGSHLAALDSTQHQVRAQLTQLDRLFAGEPELRFLQQELSVRTEERLAEIDRIVRTRQTEGSAAALHLVQSGRGRVLMDRIREVVGEIDTAKGDELREDAHVLEARGRRTLRAIRWGGTFSLLLLVGATVRIRRDVTARERAEAALRESEERFRSLAENSSDVITTMDGQGTITFESLSVTRVLGYAPEELVGTNAFDLVHPDDLPALRESFQRRLDDPEVAQTTSYRFRHRDGSWRILESRAANRLGDAAVRGIVVNSRDVTERWNAEQRLRRTTEELEAIFRASPLAVVSLDDRGQVTHWNPAAEQVFGWSAEEAVGGPLPYIPEEQRAAHAQLRERVYADEAVTGMEVLRRRKDGSPIYLSISIAPLHDDQGRVRGVLSLNEDITDRKLAERILEEYRQELERSNRELKQFAYVASHDLQEPLRMVSSYVQLLERRYASALDQDAREFIGFAVDGVRRMQQLIRDLLAFSRLGSRAPTLESVDLEALLQDLSLVQRESGAEIVHEGLPVVWADAGQMRQLLQNLVGNALKFRRPDVPPRVHLSAAEEEGRWRIMVTDNGIGIAPEYHERIFQIFQRLHTRDEYEGNGIGLAVCKKIVERHGGTLSLLSVPGEGTTFSFTLKKPSHDFHRG